MKFLLLVQLVVVLVAARTAAQVQGQGGNPSIGIGIDTDNDGYITMEEMTKSPLNINVTDGCWSAILDRADTNKDNRMTIKEFKDALDATEGMPKGCNDKAVGSGGDQVGEPAPGGGGGASSVTAAFSLMFLLAATTTFFSL